MKAYEAYCRQVENLAIRAAYSGAESLDRASFDDILDGQPSRILRHLISLTELRQLGVFFTGRRLAQKLAASLASDIERGAVVADPACGAGDLLLACASRFPISDDLDTTLADWGTRLVGSDIHPQFTRIARARLVLLALQRGARPTSRLPVFSELLPGIRLADAFSTQSRLRDVGCIVLNPPYARVTAPEECIWSSGSVSQAALFLDKCIGDASTGTRVVAVLPDVLRTGSRYIRWRKHIESRASLESIEIIGRFDPKTDVDVFMVNLTAQDASCAGTEDWWASDSRQKSPSKRIGDEFDIRVGPVVPFRDPLDGTSHPYIHAQELPAWKSIEVGSARRRFAGTTFAPPFVVVRRTSRPGDKHRAVGTIIKGKHPVAVENHLLILKPKSGLLGDCDRLLLNLRSTRTTDWLDERIRCRHLTVTALRDLPWWPVP